MRFLCVISLTTFFTFGQTGPAGVGNATSNTIWVKADAGTSSTVSGTPISTWNDQSGNSFVFSAPTVAQQPVYQTGIFNGFPAILFDNVNTAGQNDKLICPDSPLHDGTSGYTFFTVSRPLNIGTSALISKRVGVDNQHSFMLFYYTANRLFVDIESSNNRFSSNTVFANGGSYITDVIYDGTLPSAQRSRIYLGETFDKFSAETNASVPDNASNTVIGSTDPTDPRPFDGYIAEIIMYRTALNKASRIIVNNYLSAKYNIPLATNDYYAGDTPANGNYDFEVVGIGTDTIQPLSIMGSNTSFAASASGGLGISQVAGFDPNDYLMAGHNAGTNQAIKTDVGGFTGSDKCRWSRIWYIDVTNSGLGMSVNIEFDMSDGGVTPVLANPGNYVLLYRPGLSGNWTQLTTASGISGDKVLFNNYPVSLDGYYTIGSTVCSISPLPVELLNFEAVANGDGSVALNWQTASEARCGRFELSRSTDGQSFAPVSDVVCNGTASSYSEIDLPAVSGTVYYRLQCFDENGTLSENQVRSVQLAGSGFSLFPNPSEDMITVNFGDQLLHHISVIDLTGKVVEQIEVNGSSKLSVRELTAGTYIIRDETGNMLRLVKL